MAKAELAAVESTVLVELCGHFMCSCKSGFGDRQPTQIHVGRALISKETMTTPLIIEGEDHSETTELNGVITAWAIRDAINRCEGPVILGTGRVICGAIDAISRKRTNG